MDSRDFDKIKDSRRKFKILKAFLIFMALGMLTGIFLNMRLDIGGENLGKVFAGFRDWRKVCHSKQTQDFRDILVDGFCLVWGATISISLFVWELRKEYSYGLTIRNVVKMFARRLIFVCGGIYFLLCPWFFICSFLKWRCSYVWTAVCAILGMLLLLASLLYMGKFTQMRELAIVYTNKRIGNICKNPHKDMRDIIKKEIDNLPISLMLLHIDYKNYEDIDFMIQSIADTLESFEHDKRNEYTQQSICCFVLRIWLERIVYVCGAEDEFSKKRMTNILCTIQDRIQKQDRPYERKILYSMEILLVLLQSRAEGTEQVLEKVWKVSDYREELYWFMLLYIQYYLVFYGDYKWLLKKIHGKSWNTVLRNNYHSNKIVWDKNTAVRLWSSWCLYDEIPELNYQYLNAFHVDVTAFCNIQITGIECTSRVFQDLFWRGGNIL